MESESTGSLFEQLKPYIRQLISEEINKHFQQEHMKERTDISCLASKNAAVEARIVLCEQAQGIFRQNQETLAQSAEEAVESLKGLEEMIAEEVGRAQDLAQKAMERAEDAGNHTIIHEIKQPANTWTFDEYSYNINQKTAPYQCAPNSFKDILDKLTSPTLTSNPVTPQAPYKSINDQQYAELYTAVPLGDDCAKKIDNLMSQKGSVVSEMRVSTSPVVQGANYAMVVEAFSDERDVTLGYDPNTKQWMLSEIQEHPDNTKSKKKRSKK